MSISKRIALILFGLICWLMYGACGLAFINYIVHQPRASESLVESAGIFFAVTWPGYLMFVMSQLIEMPDIDPKAFMKSCVKIIFWVMVWLLTWEHLGFYRD